MKNSDWASFYCKLPDFERGEMNMVLELTDNVKQSVFELLNQVCEVELLRADIMLISAKKRLYRYELEISKEKSDLLFEVFKSTAYQSIIESVAIINN